MNKLFIKQTLLFFIALSCLVAIIASFVSLPLIQNHFQSTALSVKLVAAKQMDIEGITQHRPPKKTLLINSWHPQNRQLKLALQKILPETLSIHILYLPENDNSYWISLKETGKRALMIELEKSVYFLPIKQWLLFSFGLIALFAVVLSYIFQLQRTNKAQDVSQDT